MWWRVKFVCVLWGCVVNLVSAQQPLPGIPSQAPSGAAATHDLGVPLPQPSGPPVGIPTLVTDDDPTFVVPLDLGGVPLPPGHTGAGGQHPILNQGGVPLPPGHTGVGGGFSQDPIIVPLESGGVPLPSPTGGFGGGVPLPSPTGGFGGGVPLPSPTGGFGGGVPLPSPTGGFGGGSQGGTLGVPLPPVGAPGVGASGLGPQQPLGGAGAPGGIRHVHNPHTDTTVQRVLDLAAVRNSIQLRTRADKAVKISDVVTAHKQVVTGQLVYLTVRVGETKCSVGTPDLTSCPYDLSEDSYICEIVVWERPWLNSSKVIEEKSKCAETEDDNDFNSWGVSSSLTHSPSEVPRTALPESISEQQLAVEAFNYIDRGSESKFRGDMVNFNVGKIMFDPLDSTTKAQVNIEYGFKMCLRSADQATDPRVCPRDTQRDHYVCSVYVVHNPNQISTLEVIPMLEDDHEIHCERKRGVEEELVVPVRAPCLGCPQPAPLNDPTILDIADFALKEYDRTADEDDLHMILRLVKAQTQVVAGVKYYLTIELAETECRKALLGVDVNRTFCIQDFDEETKICDLHVVDQPWIPARDLVAAQCYDKDSYPTSSQDEFIVPVAINTNFAQVPAGSSVTSRTSQLGGQTPLQLDENTMSLARMVVAEYNRREDDPEYYKLVKVHEAASHPGNMYHVVVEMAETSCHKFDPALGNGDHCIVNPREEHEVCRAQIQEQAPAVKRIVSMSCDDLDDYLRDRLMPTLSSFDVMDHPFLNLNQGAQGHSTSGNSIPTTDHKVQEAASFVVSQYNLRGDEDELYVLTNIVSAHTQNAAGMTKFLLEVEVAETHCKKYLPVADPSRCLIDHSEEREICQAEVTMPVDPTQAKHLTKLYCDERDDYYINKLRGKFTHGGSQHHGAATALTGAWARANVNDSSIKKLGHLIADEFDLRSDEDNLFIFHKMLKAQKQVASGLKYHLVVELLETVCPKYKRRINKSRCVPDIGEDHMICEADILIQPWLSKQQVMNLQCAEKEEFHEGDDSVEILLPNVHPSAHARPVFKSHFIVRTSDESIESNERFYHPNGRINSRHHDTEEDDDDDSDEFPIFRGRRGVIGGFTEADPNDSYVKEVADFAMKSMDSLSEDTRVRVVETIDSVQKQVVKGTKYKIQLTASWTTCLKGDEVEDISTCAKDTSKNKMTCTIIVVDVPWEKSRKVTEASCKPASPDTKAAKLLTKRERRGIPGGFNSQDVNSPQIREIAEYAAHNLKTDTSRKVRALEEVVSASKQIVAGINYRLKIKVFWTNCSIDEEDFSDCKKDTSRLSMDCDVTVYDVSWLEKREITHEDCTDIAN